MVSYLNGTVKQEKEIEKKLDARSLGAISYEFKYKTIKEAIRHKKKAVLVDDPVVSFPFVESYKKLAAKVEYRMQKKIVKRWSLPVCLRMKENQQLRRTWRSVWRNRARMSS